MLSGGLSRAIDNRSLADDPETPRKMELSKTVREVGGRGLCDECVSIQCLAVIFP